MADRSREISEAAWFNHPSHHAFGRSLSIGDSLSAAEINSDGISTANENTHPPVSNDIERAHENSVTSRPRAIEADQALDVLQTKRALHQGNQKIDIVEPLALAQKVLRPGDFKTQPSRTAGSQSDRPHRVTIERAGQRERTRGRGRPHVRSESLRVGARRRYRQLATSPPRGPKSRHDGWLSVAAKGNQNGKLNAPRPTATWRCRRRSCHCHLSQFGGSGPSRKRVGERFSRICISMETRDIRSSKGQSVKRDCRFPRAHPWTSSDPCGSKYFAARQRLYVWRHNAVPGQSIARRVCSTSGASSAPGLAHTTDRCNRIGPS
jgi:hypothetical protein